MSAGGGRPRPSSKGGEAVGTDKERLQEQIERVLPLSRALTTACQRVQEEKEAFADLLADRGAKCGFVLLEVRGFNTTKLWQGIRELNKFLGNWWNCSLQRRMMSRLQVKRLTWFKNWPIDIKLEGMKNYLAWSRRALLQLQSKKLEGFINGEITEPKDKLSNEWKNWNATNALVVTWLFNSMTPTIAGSVDTITSASEIWKCHTPKFQF